MIFMKKKPAISNGHLEDIKQLKKQIEASKLAIYSARDQFEYVIDPALIDCYIYELNAAQLRYQFLLKRMKQSEKQEIS